MGSEYRRVAQLIGEGLQGFRAHSLGFQTRQGMVKRADPGISADRQLAAPIPVSKAFFGDIDQAEIGRKRADDLFETLGRQAFDQAHQPQAQSLVFLLMQIDKAGTQGLHGLKQFLPGDFLQNVAQQGTQQANLGAQFVVGQQVQWRVHGIGNSSLGVRLETAEYSRIIT